MEVSEGNVANLRYPFNAIPPTTKTEWIKRDMALLDPFLNPFSAYSQIWMPFFINSKGWIMETEDENGNNWDNNE